MRFLLDEMLSGEIAAQPNVRGVDTLAIQDHEELRQLDDLSVFAAAREQARAVVTYNVADFLAIHDDYGRRGEVHHGVVLLNSRRFHQRHPGTIGQIITGLAELAELEFPPSFLQWLQ